MNCRAIQGLHDDARFISERTKMSKLSGWKVNVSVRFLKKFSALSPSPQSFLCQVLPSSVLSLLSEIYLLQKNVADPQDRSCKTVGFPAVCFAAARPLQWESCVNQLNCIQLLLCFIDREVLNALQLSLALLWAATRQICTFSADNSSTFTWHFGRKLSETCNGLIEPNELYTFAFESESIGWTVRPQIRAESFASAPVCGWTWTRISSESKDFLKRI